MVASMFVQHTVVPTGMFTVGGLKAKPWIATGVAPAVHGGGGGGGGGPPMQSVILIESMRQPLPPMASSVPRRQRRTTFCPAADGGRLTLDVMKPLFELPVQARRPARGFGGCRVLSVPL